MTTYGERYQFSPDKAGAAQHRFELPSDDEIDIRQQLIHQAEALQFMREPAQVQRTAIGIELIRDGSRLFEGQPTKWTRFTALDARYEKDDESALVMELSFQTPQHYDYTKLSLTHDAHTWAVRPFDQQSPQGYLTHQELISLLETKLENIQGLADLAQMKPLLTDREFAGHLMDALMSQAKATTDIKTYETSELRVNDAYFGAITAKITTAEGPDAIDYRLSIGASDIPLDILDPTADGKPAYTPASVANVYEHVVTLPHDTGVPTSHETTFTVSTKNPEIISQELLHQLADSQRSVENAPQFFRNALSMFASDGYLDSAA